MATTTLLPQWLEDIKVPGTSYTAGSYENEKGVVQASFEPISVTTGLTVDTDDVAAGISQTATTSKTGVSLGIDRQYVYQSGSYFAASSPGIAMDAETPATATPLVLGISKDQTAAFSGRLVTGALTSGYDKNGDMIADDPYGGEHLLYWWDNPSFTGTFDDTAYVAAENVVLKESVTGAKATVSTGDDIFRIDPASTCQGAGQYWQGYATVLDTNLYPGPTTGGYGDDTQDRVGGPLSSYQGALTEVSTSMSSDVTLRQIEMLGVKDNAPITATLLDGSASLNGAFQSAILGDNGYGVPNKISVDLNSGVQPFQFWWEPLLTR
jgi:hypothetical protein